MYTIETTRGIRTLMHPVKSAGTSIHNAIVKNSVSYDYKVHVNQRHAHYRNLPEAYQNSDKYVVVRDPLSWYKSFYRFFLGVEGYLSFMLNDPKDDGYIYPISFDEFVLRSQNLKDTLIRFPNKARVFRNLARSQSHMHFITGYFESDFSVDDLDSMQQFDCSLYQWFMRPMGTDCYWVPMDRLDIIEDIFEIDIPHVNKTNPDKPEVELSPDVIEVVKTTEHKWYHMLDNFDPDNLKTIEESKGQ